MQEVNIEEIKSILFKKQDFLTYVSSYDLYIQAFKNGEFQDIKFNLSLLSHINFILYAFYNQTDEEILNFSNDDRKEYEEQVEKYFKYIRDTEDIIKDIDLNDLFLKYFELGYYTRYTFYENLTTLMYFISFYDDEKIKKEAREILLNVINYKQFEKVIKENQVEYEKVKNSNISTDKIEEMWEIDRLENYKIIYDYINNTYSSFNEEKGKFSNKMYDFLKDTQNKGNDALFKYFENEYRKIVEVVKKYNKGLSDYDIAENINVEIARNMHNEIKSYISNLEDYNSITYFIKEKLDAITDKYSLNAPNFIEIFRIVITKTEEAIESISKLSFEEAKKLSVIDILSLFSFEEETINYLQGRQLVKHTRKKTGKELLTTLEKVKPNETEHLNFNSSQVSQGILDARERLVYLSINDINEKEREQKLIALQEEYSKKPNKKLKEEIESLSYNIEEGKKEKKRLNDALKSCRENQKILTELYSKEEDQQERKNIEKQLKKLKQQETELVYNSNATLSMQLDLFNPNKPLLIDNEQITLQLESDSLEHIKLYNTEGTRLLLYMQDQLILNPYNTNIIIDLDEYSLETGIKGVRALKQNIIDNLEVMFHEYYSTKFKQEGISGKFRLIQSYYVDENRKKRNIIIVSFSNDYKTILLNNQYGIIPKKLLKLRGKGKNTRTFILGLFLFRHLRVNLKSQIIGKPYEVSITMKKLVDYIEKKNLDNKHDKYSKRIIEPLRESLTQLEDLGLITSDMKPFIIYDEQTAGTKESIIKEKFENELITFTFLNDEDYRNDYDSIITKNTKSLTHKKNKKKEKVKN